MTTPLALVFFILAIVLWVVGVFVGDPRRFSLLLAGLASFALPFALAAAHVG
jgi:hypothetical protein